MSFCVMYHIKIAHSLYPTTSTINGAGSFQVHHIFIILALSHVLLNSPLANGHAGGGYEKVM